MTLDPYRPIVIEIKGSHFTPYPSRNNEFTANDHRLIGLFYVMYGNTISKIEDGVYHFNFAKWPGNSRGTITFEPAPKKF